MDSLLQKLSVVVGGAFEKAGLEASYGAVKYSDRPDLAQFQCNGAMIAAKKAGKNPREVAQAIVDTLSPQSDVLQKLEIAGPGFINFNVTDSYLTAHLLDMSRDEKRGVMKDAGGEIAVLDYGGPNIAKAMHVGHLRAAIIGDSVRRMMEYAGYKTLGDVHLGDWGTHMGMLIDNYLTTGEEGIVVNTDLSSPASVEALMNDMVERYPRASGAAKENPDLMARAQATTVKLQNKEQPYYGLWEKIRDVSVLGMKANYDLLGVHFDLWKGEADVHDYIAPMVDDLRGKGHAVKSDGAWVVPVARNDDKKEVPPLILYKRDGAVMYGTTDMATIVERVKLYNPAKIVYVVDQRQSLHFEQLFRAARLGGLVRDDVELTHAGFGTMNGADGKPFKTRAGGVMRLDDLLAMGLEKARARMEEAHIGTDMDAGERDDIAHKIAIAAIRFADLQNQRQADYVFDMDRLISFEGKTGPYMLYQAVRIKSLLAKAGYDVSSLPSFDLQDGDKALVLLLTAFPESLAAALENYAPHFVADYAYRLAQAFSSFYGNCHILSEEDEALRNSRLALCAQTYRTLECALGLLGISIPNRM